MCDGSPSAAKERAEAVPVAFDCDLMRPACVLVAAGIGGSVEAAKRFPTETWLLAPTDGMRVYMAAPAQLDLLVRRVEVANRGR